MSTKANYNQPSSPQPPRIPRRREKRSSTGVETILKNYPHLATVISTATPQAIRRAKRGAVVNILQQAIVINDVAKPKTIPKEMYAEYTKKEAVALDFINQFYDPEIGGFNKKTDSLSENAPQVGFKRRGSIGIRDLGAGYTYIKDQQIVLEEEHQEQEDSSEDDWKESSADDINSIRSGEVSEIDSPAGNKRSKTYKQSLFIRSDLKASSYYIKATTPKNRNSTENQNTSLFKSQKQQKRAVGTRNTLGITLQTKSSAALVKSPVSSPRKLRRGNRAKKTINLGSSTQYNHQYHQSLLNQRQNLVDQLKGMLSLIEDPFEKEVYSECLPKIINSAAILQDKKSTIGVRRKSADFTDLGFLEELEDKSRLQNPVEKLLRLEDCEVRSVNALSLKNKDNSQKKGWSPRKIKRGGSKKKGVQETSNLHFNIREIFWTMVSRSQVSNMLGLGITYEQMSFFFPDFLSKKHHSCPPAEPTIRGKNSVFHSKKSVLLQNNKKAKKIKRQKNNENHHRLSFQARRSLMLQRIEKLELLEPKAKSKVRIQGSKQEGRSEAGKSKMEATSKAESKRTQENRKSATGSSNTGSRSDRQNEPAQKLKFKDHEKRAFFEDEKVQKTYHILRCLQGYYQFSNLEKEQIQRSIRSSWVKFERDKVPEEDLKEFVVRHQNETELNAIKNPEKMIFFKFSLFK